MSEDPRIVAVIPAWHARERLPALLDALQAEDLPVIVVDNGSQDGSAAWLRAARPEVQLLALGHNHGWAGAINRGVAAARESGESAVLLLNDDCLPAPGAPSILAAALADQSRLGAVTPRLVYAARPGVLNSTGSLWDPRRARVTTRGDGEPDDGRYADARAVDAPSGACCLIRMAALLEVGPFDEQSFLYYDDVDWGLRAAAAGWPTAYVPEAVAHHHGSLGTADDAPRRRYYNVRNHLRFARRHATGRGVLRAWAEAVIDMPRQLLRACGPPARRADAFARLHGLADALRGVAGRSERYG